MALSPEEFARLQELHKEYGGPAKITEPPKSTGGYKPFGSFGDAAKTFGSNVVSSWKQRVSAGEDEAFNAIQGDTSLPEATLRMVGQGAGAVGGVGFELLKLAIPKFGEDLARKGTEAVASTQPVQDLFTKYQDFKANNPDTAKDLEAVGNILSVVPVGKGVQLAAKGTEKAVATLPKVATATSKRLGTAIDERRLLQIAQKEQKVNETIGKIIQGQPKDIEKAKRALSEIDVSEVKSYKDLNNAFDNQIEALMRTQDKYLERVDGRFTPADVAKTTKVGDRVVTQNFVSDALDQLDEMYGAIKDAPEQLRVQQLRDKFNTEGLTAKELNDVARTYGTEFGQKAFGKTGEALTSVNAQAFENTRKGIKSAARGVVSSNAKSNVNISQELDRKISDMIATKKLTDKMEVKVNALWQRVSKRGLAERIARGTATAVDTLTLKTVSGFMSRMLPSNVGLKTVNSIDLEEQLAKNLKSIDKVMKADNDYDMISAIMQEMKSSIDEPSMGMSTRDVTRFLHTDDKKLMEGLIDEVRIGKRMTDAEYAQVEKLAERFGVSTEDGLSNMANKFEQILQGNRDFTGTVLPGMRNSNSGKPVN